MRRRTGARGAAQLARVREFMDRHYEELKQKGVQFAGAPQERFFGVEAIIKDGLGNWFSMTQPKHH